MHEKTHRQATLHDVARLANVSHQTVSRVINNSPNVADETRVRVLAAINELHYRPNRAARSLITGSSQTIQVVIFEETYLTPIPAIVSEANGLGYRVGLSVLPHEHTPEEMRELFDDLTSRLVDGFLLFDPQENFESDEIRLLCRGIPFVQMGGDPVEKIPAVLIDHEAGMRQVMDHLLGLGHRKIAEISGPERVFDARVRHRVYLEKMRVAGLEPGPSCEGDFGADTAYHHALDLLQGGAEFSAIVCANDESALGVLRALHECGLRVPEDVSVTGFDDHPPVRFYEPPLTTVRQDYAEMSRVGIKFLVDLIAEPDLVLPQKILEPQLIIRESTRAI